jgi:hypothetical protein
MTPDVAVAVATQPALAACGLNTGTVATKTVAATAANLDAAIRSAAYPLRTGQPVIVTQRSRKRMSNRHFSGEALRGLEPLTYSMRTRIPGRLSAQAVTVAPESPGQSAGSGGCRKPPEILLPDSCGLGPKSQAASKSFAMPNPARPAACSCQYIWGYLFAVIIRPGRLILSGAQYLCWLSDVFGSLVQVRAEFVQIWCVACSECRRRSGVSALGASGCG